MEDIKLTYKPDIDELVRVSRYLTFRVLRYITIAIPVVFLFVTTTRNVGVGNVPDEKPFWAEFAPAILLSVLWFFVIWRTLKKSRAAIEKNSRNYETQEMRFDAKGFHQKGETFEMQHNWQNFHKIKETKSWFLLFFNANSALPIVKKNLTVTETASLKGLFMTLPIKKDLK